MNYKIKYKSWGVLFQHYLFLTIMATTAAMATTKKNYKKKGVCDMKKWLKELYHLTKYLGLKFAIKYKINNIKERGR